MDPLLSIPSCPLFSSYDWDLLQLKLHKFAEMECTCSPVGNKGYLVCTHVFFPNLNFPRWCHRCRLHFPLSFLGQWSRHNTEELESSRTATQQGSGKVGKWKTNFLSTQKYAPLFTFFHDETFIFYSLRTLWIFKYYRFNKSSELVFLCERTFFLS